MEAPPARILVVDDDPWFRYVMIVALEGEGYSVQTAPDGIVGTAWLHSWRPDLVLLDVMMPNQDGLEFLEAYEHQEGRRSPVIVCSAYPNRRGRTLAAGAVAFIEKPFELSELLEAVR